MAPPLKKDSRYHQGIFVPMNQDKFIGKTCIYRSGLELKFMRFCDNNPNVIKWGSECVTIPYYSKIDNKWHKYYVDNFVHIKEGDVTKKYLVEIKPHKKTQPPTTKYKKKSHLLYEQTEWVVNTCKWDAAKDFCKRNKMNFIIITEKELN